MSFNYLLILLKLSFSPLVYNNSPKFNNPVILSPNSIILSSVDYALNLSVIFDKNMSFARHISAVSKSCFHNICDQDVFIILLIKLLHAILLLFSFTLNLTIVTLFYSICLLLKRIVFTCPKLCCSCWHQNS